MAHGEPSFPLPNSMTLAPARQPISPELIHTLEAETVRALAESQP